MPGTRTHDAERVMANAGTGLIVTFRPGGPDRPAQYVHAGEAQVRAMLDSIARENPEVLLAAVLRAIAERGATAALDRRER